MHSFIHQELLFRGTRKTDTQALSVKGAHSSVKRIEEWGRRSQRHVLGMAYTQRRTPDSDSGLGHISSKIDLMIGIQIPQKKSESP